MDSLTHLRWSHAPRAQQEWNQESGRYVPASCLGYQCDSRGGYMGLPYCRRCTMHLWSKMDDLLPEDAKAAAKSGEFVQYEMRKQAEWNEERLKREAAEAKRKRESRDRETAPGIIYYLRVGTLVKIGYTANMDRRMKQYPPHAELLAQHPGTMRVEREMHNKFATHLAKGREWFTPCDAINAHLESVKERYPQPHLMSKEKRIQERKQGQEEAWRRARERADSNPYRPRPIGGRSKA